MGNAVRRYLNSDFLIFVRTGDRKHASTDANVKIILINEDGVKSYEIVLDNILRDDFKKGASDTFSVRNLRDFGRVEKIEFWRDNAGVSPDWYVEKIMVENVKTNEMSVFPVFRWIKANYHYKIRHLDTVLPQDDEQVEQRKMELEDKRKIYIASQKGPGLPMMAENLPTDEQFSFEYKWSIVRRKAQLIATSKLVKLKEAGEWASFVDLFKVYTRHVFCKPMSVQSWRNDLNFGLQRITGCNPSFIKLCTEIPENMGVDEEMLKPQLEDKTLEEVIEEKRLFYTDHKIMDGLKHREDFNICAPIALFLLNNKGHLIPIAIQLQQQKGPDNPVFTPTDPPGTWTRAKMWYNNADAAIHQSLTHLAFTHLLMEGIVIATQRNISLSHPVFKLLAPHTLYLLAINARGLMLLISEGGWVDTTMNIGIVGMFELISRGVKEWRIDVDGCFPEYFKQQGTLLRDIDYFFSFCSVFSHFNSNPEETPEKLTGDWEIQNWAEELARSKEEGGIGIKGIPMEDGKGCINTVKDLVLILTSIVFTCSVGHASSNFPQYDEYGFPANYPAYLKGPVPTDKSPCTEEDILKLLPDKRTTLDIMTVTKILSSKGTNSLGDFEIQYIFDPKAIPIVNKFRSDLKHIGVIIRERNSTRNPPYTYLDPIYIPNSISI
ncbi:allene oxide synthase-lipoxygenase protein [Octopus bimaculoides]|uniref:allene oxide synthase-lipoxygenase protein n=1 Tax=Octopus bimaculoides TaxID=37653 RepID=UPI0022E331D6|nr:allene oxide synthase-lipoxygenase protein [Octopus bimaculoides]